MEKARKALCCPVSLEIKMETPEATLGKRVPQRSWEVWIPWAWKLSWSLPWSSAGRARPLQANPENAPLL